MKNIPGLKITTMSACDNRRQGKTIEFRKGIATPLKEETKSYKFTRKENEVKHDIDALHDFLSTVPVNAFVVTGQPIDDGLDKVRNLMNTCPKNGDKPTLVEYSSAWLPVDIDKITLKYPLDTEAKDIQYTMVEMAERIGLADYSFVWNLTSSASPGQNVVSARLYFLVDKPISSADRKGFGLSLPPKLIDTSIYRANGAIYTAPPLSSHDPFMTRWGVVYGENEAIEWDRLDIKPATSARIKPEYIQYGEIPSDIDLRHCNSHTYQLINGQCWDSYHNDGSLVLWAVVVDLYKVGYTPEEILGIVTNPLLAIAQVAAKHCKSNNIDDQRKWIGAYTLPKAIAKAKESILKPERATTTPNPAVPVAIAEKQLKEAVLRFRDGDRHMVIRSTVGLGKTHQTAEAMIDAPGNVLWFAPTHNQAIEVTDKINADFLLHPAIRILGRGAETQDGEHVCKKHEAVEALKEKGLSQFTSNLLCGQATAKAEQKCKYRHSCHYFQQFKAEQKIRVVPHAYLNNPQAALYSYGDFYENVSHCIIDESPLSTLVGHHSISFEKLVDDMPLLLLVNRLKNNEEVSLEEVQALIEALPITIIPDINPSTHPIEVKFLLEDYEHKQPTLGLLMALEKYAQGEKNLVWFGEAGDKVFYARKGDIRLKPTLILDATAERAVYDALLGADNYDFVEINAEQNLKIFQVIDQPVGKKKLIDDAGYLPAVIALAKSTNSALITHLDGINYAKEKKWLNDDDTSAHFNALRGLNSLESCNSLVIAGRIEPNALAVEAIARSLWSSADLCLSGSYIELNVGDRAARCHADERVDAVLRLHREAELEQAIGRLRAVRSPTTKFLYVITNAPLSLPNITKVKIADILMDRRQALVMLRDQGVLIKAKNYLLKAHPDLFQSIGEIHQWLMRLENGFKGYEPYIYTYYSVCTPYSFRLKGQRGSMANAVSWLDDAGTMDAIETLTHGSIISFEAPEKPVIEMPLTDSLLKVAIKPIKRAWTQGTDKDLVGNAPTLKALFESG